MKKCPVCKLPLTALEYEGLSLMQCGKCRGHLVSATHMRGITRSITRPKDMLKAEVSTEFKQDTHEALRCPRCFMPMRKQALDIPMLNVHADVCDTCRHVWLDGGELALLQLAYESTGKAANIEDLKRRLKEMEESPERKAAFEENLARMPASRDTAINEEDVQMFLLGVVGKLSVLR